MPYLKKDNFIKLKTKVYSIAGGLGGKDVTVEHIKEMLAKVKKEKEPFQIVWGE